MMELQNPVPANPPCCPAQDFSAFEFTSSCTDPGGCVRWVGPPGTFLESKDSPALGSFRAARLQCTPHYRNWSAEGLVYVVGAEVVPSSTYDIEQVAESCQGLEEACTAVSGRLTVNTARAGDLVANFNPPHPSTQPDANDVAASVNKFKNLVGAPKKYIAQVQPNFPDLNADMSALDIATVVDGVKGFRYPFSGPCVCPSTVPCNVTACATASACTTPHGAGATCLRTCSGGPNNGMACNSDQNCNACNGGTFDGLPCDPAAMTPCPEGGACQGGGVCGPGFCRDRCGRCAGSSP
jgi:hypothetical protein